MLHSPAPRLASRFTGEEHRGTEDRQHVFAFRRPPAFRAPGRIVIYAAALIWGQGLAWTAEGGAPAAAIASGNGPAAETSPSSLQGDIDHPYYLPQASRARMHQCAVEWQRMKLAGEADTITWRSFAASCLVSQDEKTGGTQAHKKER